MTEKSNNNMILRQIKSYYQFKTDTDFAAFLGIPIQTLSSWYRRDMFDMVLIYKKCPAIHPDFLFTGKQPMLRQNLSGANPEITTLQNKLIAEFEKNRELEQQIAILRLGNEPIKEQTVQFFKKYLEELNEFIQQKKDNG